MKVVTIPYFLIPITYNACPPLIDPNQLIRASALRVLSSIRVPIIVPIMMLAIKEAASDMSPYVRKTAAHAIPKLYRYAQPRPSLLGVMVPKAPGHPWPPPSLAGFPSFTLQMD